MSKQTYLPEFRKIREALENNNLVIFVGAGYSLTRDYHHGLN